MDKKEKHRDGTKKTRILIVDNNSAVRLGMIELINQERSFMVCAKAENSDRALEAIEKQEVDLAIVDISLEGTNGIELTEKIKSRYPHLPVLILTMHNEPIYAKRAFKAGARGYVTKQEVAETIITAIRLMLSGKDYIGERMAQKFLKNLHSAGPHC